MRVKFNYTKDELFALVSKYNCTCESDPFGRCVVHDDPELWAKTWDKEVSEGVREKARRFGYKDRSKAKQKSSLDRETLL